MKPLADKIYDKIYTVKQAGKNIALIKLNPYHYRQISKDPRSDKFLDVYKSNSTRKTLFGYPVEVIDHIKDIKIITDKEYSEVIF